MWCLGLTFSSSYTNCLKICELQPSGPVAGLYRDCFTFMSYLDRYITVKHRVCLFDHSYCVMFIFKDLH